MTYICEMWYVDKHHYTLQFNKNLYDLDVDSRSQDYEKVETFGTIF